MALKITTQIGTDKGITSEAYVRIADYQVSKYGSANFRIELFQKQSDSVSNQRWMGGGQSRNQQIGDSVDASLTKEVSQVVTVKRMMPVEVDFSETITHPDGTETTTTGTRIEMQEQDVQETQTTIVPDMSSLEDSNIFEFGYSHLKAKLVGLFGAENVVDC